MVASPQRGTPLKKQRFVYIESYELELETNII